jgi:hypothetical protein
MIWLLHYSGFSIIEEDKENEFFAVFLGVICLFTLEDETLDQVFCTLFASLCKLVWSATRLKDSS